MTRPLPVGLHSLASAIAPALGLPCVAPASAVDWHELERLAERHRVVALLARGVAQRSATDPVRERLRLRARAEALRSLERLAFQREALLGLGDAGVPVLVLKGAAQALEAYGDPNAREAFDIDLLIGLPDLEQAHGVLQRAGLRATASTSWLADDPYALVRNAERGPLISEVQLIGRGVMVDLHWRLTANPHLLPVRERWLRDPEYVTIAGGEVPVLPMPERWWFAFAHGAGHQWMRLKWLADVAAWSVRHPEHLEPAALRATEKAGLERCVAGGLELAEELFGPFLDRASRAWVRRNVHPVVQARARRALAADRPRELDNGRDAAGYALGKILLRRGVGYRREEVRRLLLIAGRAQGRPDPGWKDLVSGVPSWMRRRLRP